MKPEDHIALRLAAIGVKPEEVKYVVISHLHSDHTGFIELFPNAKLYVHEDEFAQRYKQNEQSDDSNGGDMAFWLSQNLTWIKLFQAGTSGEEFELLPGLTILNFGPGHSYGMLGLLIDLPKTGKIILASDAVYNRENVGPPVKVAGNMYDRDGFIRTIEKVTAYADKIGAQLWYGHDEPQFAALIKSPNGYYE
jgi:glyoxylase-like metal-dependent hydrolase (beta-lactamase superfamily II)